jgi:hypothetical protein
MHMKETETQTRNLMEIVAKEAVFDALHQAAVQLHYAIHHKKTVVRDAESIARLAGLFDAAHQAREQLLELKGQ